MEHLLRLLFAAVYVIAYSFFAVRAFQCGSQTLYTQDRGVIKSHVGYDAGRQYGRDLDCVWTIQAPPGKFVQLTAEDFNLETRSCNSDYVEVFDGNNTASPSLGKFCGNIFNTMSSKGRFLTLQFVTNYIFQYRGFKLFYNFTDHTITSCPVGGDFLCKNGRCVHSNWRCDGADDCGDDSDEQNCPPLTCPPGRWLCANKKCVPASYVCDGDEDCGDGSDEIKCHGGKPQIDNILCRQNFTGISSGTISSPGYPNDYPGLSSCMYHIFLPAGSNKLAVSFESKFGLEADTLCAYDYVQVYSLYPNGNTQNVHDNLIAVGNPRDQMTRCIEFVTIFGSASGPFCGTTSPSKFIVRGNHVVVEFVSDDNDSYMGFRLHWRIMVFKSRTPL